jgi:hypothetical protein
VHWLESEGATWRRSLWRGRRKVAKALGGVDARNTQRRLHRLEELGILRIVRGGGRIRGCRKDDRRGLRGRANRHYPGPAIVDPLITDRWIAEDGHREREREQDNLAPSRDDVAPAPAASFRELAARFGEARAGP